MMKQIPERDWKVLRELKPLALDRFCQRVFEKVSHLISDTSTGSHDRYLALYKMIHDEDEKLGVTFNGMSRSNALINLLNMRHRKLLTDEEVSRFTEETRKFSAGL